MTAATVGRGDEQELFSAVLDRERGLLPELVLQRQAERAAAWQKKLDVLRQLQVPAPAVPFLSGVLAAGEMFPVVRDLVATAQEIEQHVLSVLERSGPVGADHRQTIEHVSWTMASMLLEPKQALEVMKAAPPEMQLFLDTGTRRVAIPLAVGLGKTVSATALALQCHKNLTIDPYLRDPMSRGLLYTTSNVRLLCTFRDGLIAAGIPEDRIGLIYSRGVTCAHPSIAPAHVGHYPILLCTQAMVMAATARDWLPEAEKEIKRAEGKLFVDDVVMYRNRERVTVWDESFSSSLAEGLSRFQLTIANAALGNEPARQQLLAESQVLRGELDSSSLESLASGLAVLAGRLSEAADDVATVLSDKKTKAVRTVVIPDELAEQSRQLHLVGRALCGMANQGLGMALKALAQMTRVGGVEVSVLGEPGSDEAKDQALQLVRPRLVVSDKLRRLIVLDANYEASLLSKLESTVKLATSSAIFGRELEPVRYDRVSIRFYAEPAGRSAMTGKKLDNPKVRARIIREQVQRAAVTPADERCLFVTFTHHKEEGGPNFTAEIIAALRKHFPGWDQQLLIDGKWRPRVEVLTWGEHEGLNEFADCAHLFFVGVMYRPWVSPSAGASLRNQLYVRCGDNQEAFEAVDAKELEMNQAVCALLQALGRGAMRRVVNGQAGRMTAHVPIKEISGRWSGKAPCKGSPAWESLQAWMPGVQMESSSAAPLPTVTEQVMQAAEQVLDQQAPDVVSISSKALTQEMEKLLQQAGLALTRSTQQEALAALLQRNERLHAAGVETWVKPTPTSRSWMRSTAVQRQQVA